MYPIIEFIGASKPGNRAASIANLRERRGQAGLSTRIPGGAARAVIDENFQRRADAFGRKYANATPAQRRAMKIPAGMRALDAKEIARFRKTDKRGGNPKPLDFGAPRAARRQGLADARAGRAAAARRASINEKARATRERNKAAGVKRKPRRPATRSSPFRGST